MARLITYLDHNGEQQTVDLDVLPVRDPAADFEQALEEGRRALAEIPEMDRPDVSLEPAPAVIQRNNRDLPLDPQSRIRLQQTVNNLARAAAAELVKRDYFQQADDRDRAARARVVLAQAARTAAAGWAPMPDFAALHEKMADFLAAYSLYLEWDAIPAKLGVSVEEERRLRDVVRFRAAVERQSHNAALADQEVRRHFGEEMFLACRSYLGQQPNPAKEHFWREHQSTLDRYFRGDWRE